MIPCLHFGLRPASGPFTIEPKLASWVESGYKSPKSPGPRQRGRRRDGLSRRRRGQFRSTAPYPAATNSRGVSKPSARRDNGLTFNMTWDEQEGRWKAGRFRDIKRDAPYFQAAFRVRLANKLHDLGLTLERRGDDFEVSGIPSDVLKRFSRRTELIERVARERGITDPVWKRELGPRSKESRGKLCGLDALRKEWKARLTRPERQLLSSVCRPKRRVAPEVNGEALAVDHAIEHCFVRDAVVPER